MENNLPYLYGGTTVRRDNKKTLDVANGILSQRTKDHDFCTYRQISDFVRPLILVRTDNVFLTMDIKIKINKNPKKTEKNPISASQTGKIFF